MSDRESGSSLIWFVSLLALVVLVLLTLVSSLHQFLFARKLHDYTEQVALAGKTWLSQGLTVSEVEDRFSQLPEFPRKITDMKVTYQDGRTLEVSLCSTWLPPVPAVVGSVEICENAKAR